MMVRRNSLLPISFLIAVFAVWMNAAVAAGPGHAAGPGWDASTRVINSSVTDADIQLALSRALPPAFAQTLPVHLYGMFVLIDKSQSKELSQEVVYIFLSLCKRRPDGGYELPLATYSIMFPLNTHAGDQERQLITQRLANEAAVFAQVMIQNAARLR